MADASTAAAPAPVITGEQASQAEPVAPAEGEAAPASAGPSAGSVPEAGSGPGSAAKRLFKLTVDGQTEEYDASDDARVAADLQKGRHAQRQVSEQARRLAFIEKAREAAQGNPRQMMIELAKGLGLDPQKVSQEMVAEELQRQIEADELAAMSPEQRKAWQDQKDLEKYRAAEKEREEQDKQTKEQERISQRSQAIAAKLDQAISHGLEGTPLAGDNYAQYIFAAHVQSLAEDVMAGKLKGMPHPKVIAKYVETQIQRLGTKYAPPVAATPPPAPAKHPASKPRGAPKTPGVQRARDPGTGQFLKGFTYGTDIYKGLAETAEKNPRKLGFRPVPKFMPGT